MKKFIKLLGCTALLAIAIVYTSDPLLADTDAGKPAATEKAEDCSSCETDVAPKSTALCEAHGVSVDLCYICDPSKREAGRLWCNGHDRYEDRCWICQPQLEDKDRPWCKEHSLYEDECFYCHPEIIEKQNASAAASSTSPQASASISTEVCEAHEVSVDLCYICDSSKREAGRLWCKEHDRYEDRCWLCHPELEDEDRLWCDEHSLYEDECFYCDPARSVNGIQQGSSKESNAPALWCKEHDVAELECGICQPQLAGQLAPGKSVKVRFASAESSSKAGIATAYPTEGLAQPSVSAFFEVSYNRNKLALVTPLADGIVRVVHADVGQSVRKGDVLVEISSDEVASAKADFLTRQVDERIAELAYQREKKLKEEKISAARDFLEAEAVHEIAQLKSKMARQKLLNLGFSDAEIAQIAKDQDSSSTIKLRAPFAGTLVAREAVVGEAVSESEGKALFKVTDLSTLWLDLSVSPEYADSVQVGQILTARFDGGANDIEYPGVITWVDSAIDPRNRMLKARAEIQNPHRTIRQGMFGHAELVLTGAGNAVLLPRDAIQHHEGRPYVFVKEAPDLYALRHVSLGQSGNDTVAVTEGLGADELVVTEGAFIAMSEFLKSRLGAGCVDD